MIQTIQFNFYKDSASARAIKFMPSQLNRKKEEIRSSAKKYATKNVQNAAAMN